MNTTKKKIDINTRIDDLEVDIRIQNCLNSAGIKTLAELLKVPHHVLKKIPNFGQRSINKLDDFLERHEITGKEMCAADFACYLKYYYEERNEKTDMAANFIWNLQNKINDLEKQLDLKKWMNVYGITR